MNWRLLITPPADGAANMALDEVLLHSLLEGGPPTVRLYAWDPPCLSVGTNQPLAAQIDTEWCAANGITLVRRPTGGRAVLHDGPAELTYSLTARESDPRVSGGVVESYRKISTGLVLGLAHVGIAARMAVPGEKPAFATAATATPAAIMAGLRAELAAARSNGRPNPASSDPAGAVCFDEATDYEITVEGRKVIGSAQTRRNGAILQQGSVLLRADLGRWARAFRFADEADRRRAQTRLAVRMAGLAEFAPAPPTFDRVAEALVAGLGEALDVRLVPGALTPAEDAAWERLRAEKYLSEEWTFRK
jgi:lipoate-protein ligase A